MELSRRAVVMWCRRRPVRAALSAVAILWLSLSWVLIGHNDTVDGVVFWIGVVGFPVWAVLAVDSALRMLKAPSGTRYPLQPRR